MSTTRVSAGGRAVKRTVTLVDLTVYDHMAPLVPAYLQAYAELNPNIRESYAW